MTPNHNDCAQYSQRSLDFMDLEEVSEQCIGITLESQYLLASCCDMRRQRSSVINRAGKQAHAIFDSFSSVLCRFPRRLPNTPIFQNESGFLFHRWAALILVELYASLQYVHVGCQMVQQFTKNFSQL